MRTEPPTSITLPWTLVVDSREQSPWHFLSMTRHHPTYGDLPLVVPLLTDVALKSGDYSIRGFESRVAIERKSRGDWLSSITHDRPRFEREMERMAELDYAAVVIESDRQGIEEAQSRVPLATSDGTIAAWSVRYGVHFFLNKSRREAECWTLRLLEQFWKRVEREKKEQEQREFIESLAGAVA